MGISVSDMERECLVTNNPNQRPGPPGAIQNCIIFLNRLRSFRFSLINIKLFFVIFLKLSAFSQAFAHAPEQSYVYLTIDDHAVSGRVEITHRDLNTLFGLNWPERMRVEQHQIDVGRLRIAQESRRG